MEGAYNSLGKPGIFRNDRFWLAGDHVVDPRIKNMPKVKALTAASKRAREDFRLTEYQGDNVCILEELSQSFSVDFISTQLCIRNSVESEHSRVCW